MSPVDIADAIDPRRKKLTPAFSPFSGPTGQFEVNYTDLVAASDFIRERARDRELDIQFETVPNYSPARCVRRRSLSTFTGCR